MSASPASAQHRKAGALLRLVRSKAAPLRLRPLNKPAPIPNLLQHAKWLAQHPAELVGCSAPPDLLIRANIREVNSRLLGKVLDLIAKGSDIFAITEWLNC